MKSRLFKYVVIGLTLLLLNGCMGGGYYYAPNPTILIASKKLPDIKDNNKIFIR
jgi:hypothetical protein